MEIRKKILNPMINHKQYQKDIFYLNKFLKRLLRSLVDTVVFKFIGHTHLVINFNFQS